MTAAATPSLQNLACRGADMLQPLLPAIDPAQSILIGGSFRSGTTWLAETIAALPGMLMVFEPLSTRASARVRALRLDFPQAIPPQAEFAEFQALLDGALSGRGMTPWMLRAQPIGRLLSRRRLVVKLIDCGLYLRWLLESHPGLRPLYLIRNPLAVVDSMLRAGWMKDVEAYPAPSTTWNAELHARHQHVLDAIRGPAEVIAARWALENAAVVNDPEVRKRLVLLDYDRLTGTPERLLDLLDTAYGLDVSSLDTNSLRRPSSSTRNSRRSAERGCILTERQADRVRFIVRELGADIYSDDGVLRMPDDLEPLSCGPVGAKA